MVKMHLFNKLFLLIIHLLLTDYRKSNFQLRTIISTCFTLFIGLLLLSGAFPSYNKIFEISRSELRLVGKIAPTCELQSTRKYDSEQLKAFSGRCLFRQYTLSKPVQYAATSYAWNIQIFSGKDWKYS